MKAWQAKVNGAAVGSSYIVQHLVPLDYQAIAIAEVELYDHLVQPGEVEAHVEDVVTRRQEVAVLRYLLLDTSGVSW